MIGYLAGQILEHHDGKMLVTIGTPGASVGYQLQVPQTAEFGSYKPGRAVELYIYTHVREDAFDLYGFSSREEKELFLTLLNVNGIGPKVALGILSKVSASQLIQAILDGDKDTLVQIPGIGKKTAERVVLELADTMKKKVDAGNFGNARGFGTGAVSAATQADLPLRAGLAEIFKDARDALIGLGYREQDVSVLLKRVNESKTPPTRVEDVVRMALQQLG